MYDLMNAVNSIFDDSLFFPSMRNIRFNTDGVLDMRPAKWYIWKEDEGDEDSKIPVTKGVYAVVKCLGIAEEDVSVNLKDDCVIVQGKTEVKGITYSQYVELPVSKQILSNVEKIQYEAKDGLVFVYLKTKCLKRNRRFLLRRCEDDLKEKVKFN